MRATLLVLSDIVRNVFARKLFRDRLATAGMDSLVRSDRRRAARVGGIRCFDRGEDLGLVEQHLLIGARIGRVVLGAAAEDLRLPPAELLLQEHGALAVAGHFALEPRVLKLQRPDLLALRAQSSNLLLRDVQSRCKLGIFVLQIASVLEGLVHRRILLELSKKGISSDANNAAFYGVVSTHRSHRAASSAARWSS